MNSPYCPSSTLPFLKNLKVKAKTSIYLDGDVWDKLHEDAEKASMKYQPFLKQLLSRAILHEKSDLEKRLERLDSVVLKNKAN